MQGFERMLSYEEYPEEKSRLWSSSFDDMTILSSVVLRKQEFSAFLIFAVWTSSVTYLTFGKGELQDENHFLSLYSYFSPCYLIFHHSLFLFRWFTTVDALSLQCVNITKLIFAVFRKKKKKKIKTKICHFKKKKKKKTKNCYDEEFRQLRVFSKIFFVKIG